MKDLRTTLIEGGPFNDISFTCDGCDQTLFDVEDYTYDEPFKNEVLLQYRIMEHAKETGHINVSGQIDPMNTVQEVDAIVTVVDDVVEELK